MSHSPSAFPSIATATSLGPWPGTDPVEAAKVGLGLLLPPHLPMLASLPARGVGSDPVGRTAAMLVELNVDVQPYGWRFVDRAGLDQRRAISALSTDINVLADVVGAEGQSPSEFKVHVQGPLSMAAAIHLHHGERSLRDYGARRDIAQSLAAGLALHAARVSAAVPGARLTLQIDEPDVAAALAGTIPTASGYRTLRAVPATELRQTWSEFVAVAHAAGFTNVVLNLARTEESRAVAANTTVEVNIESSAWRSALTTALESGVDAVALPLHGLDTGHWEKLAEAIENGVGVWAGTVPVSGGGIPPSYSVLLERIMRPWRGLGLDESRLNQLRITPEGQLAELGPSQAQRVVARALEVADALTELRNN